MQQENIAFLRQTLAAHRIVKHLNCELNIISQKLIQVVLQRSWRSQCGHNFAFVPRVPVVNNVFSDLLILKTWKFDFSSSLIQARIGLCPMHFTHRGHRSLCLGQIILTSILLCVFLQVAVLHGFYFTMKFMGSVLVSLICFSLTLYAFCSQVVGQESCHLLLGYR